MRKKLTLIIVALSLIVSFGFTNAYAEWVEGDPSDWYFQLEATDSTTTVWDVTFHAVEDTFLASFFFDMQSNNSDAGFVSGVYDMDFYMKGFAPMGVITFDDETKVVKNVGGGIMGGGFYFAPEQSMTIAHLTFDTATDLDMLWSENPFYTTDINGQMWAQSNLLETNDGITAPYFDLHDKGLNPNPNTYGQTVPVPAAIWLLGSAMLGLFGINKRKKN